MSPAYGVRFPRMVRFEVAPARPSRWTTAVVVGAGLLDRAAQALVRSYRGRRLVVVADATVARLHARRFARSLTARGGDVTLLTFPAGEGSKTRETKAALEDRLYRDRVGRETAVIAFGGGVTGDLAGFLAATWQRGVPVVQIPTTTLAMLDAALGGKTGVDLEDGKNLIGVFHQPESVWADVNLLATLSERAYRSGLAEAVKMAAALDGPLFRELEKGASRLLARQPALLARVVARCLALKGRIVAADERDAGRRMILNFGHTAAHALESASAYRIPHGEAVAIGLVAESAVAVKVAGMPRAHAARIESLLVALHLPVRPPRGLDAARLHDALSRDKKSRARIVRCALPRRLGRMPDGPDPTFPIDPPRDLLPFLASN